MYTIPIGTQNEHNDERSPYSGEVRAPHPQYTPLVHTLSPLSVHTLLRVVWEYEGAVRPSRTPLPPLTLPPPPPAAQVLTSFQLDAPIGWFSLDKVAAVEDGDDHAPKSQAGTYGGGGGGGGGAPLAHQIEVHTVVAVVED